jgi:hypothetical protein
MISLTMDDMADPLWNKRLLSSQLGTLYQTKEYAQYLELRLKIKPIFLKFINEKGSIIGQLLVFQTFKGKTRIESSFGRGIISNNLSKIAKFLPKHIRWAYGPVIFEKSYEIEIAEHFGNWLKSIKGSFQGHSHPLDLQFDFPSQLNFNKEKTTTFIIDLKEDLELIFKNTDKNSVQKNIKRSEDRGVNITSIKSKQDLVTYYELQKSYREENKLISYQFDDMFEGFNLLSPLGYEGFIAWIDKIPIGSISFSTFNGYINESGIARTKLDTTKKLYSQDLLRWKIIEWGKENNCNYYDLSGVKPDSKNPKDEGIYRNKKKWGGKQYDYWFFKS